MRGAAINPGSWPIFLAVSAIYTMCHGPLCSTMNDCNVSKVPLEIFGSRHSNRQYRQPFQEIASVRKAEEETVGVRSLNFRFVW